MMSTLIHLTISLCLMNKTDNSSERFFRLSFLISQSEYRLKCFALASLPEQVDSDYQCLMTLLHQVFNDTIYCLLHEGAYVCCLCYFYEQFNFSWENYRTNQYKKFRVFSHKVKEKSPWIPGKTMRYPSY